MAKMIDAFVFDMDGTVLDTLPDLVDVTNETLEHFGYPTHSQREIVAMVGHGLRSLISQALPQNLPADVADKAIAYWKAQYDARGNQKTQVYEGMMDALEALRARGMRIAILSNKYDAGVKMMAEAFFGALVEVALGEGPVPRKPDPAGLRLVSQMLNVPLERIAYVGDSDTDMETAHNAGALAVGVTWGYQPRERIEAHRPDVLIDHPSQLLSLADGMNDERNEAPC